MVFVPELYDSNWEERLAGSPRGNVAVVDRKTGTIYYRGQWEDVSAGGRAHGLPREGGVIIEPHSTDVGTYRDRPYLAPNYDEERKKLKLLRRLRTRHVADVSSYAIPYSKMKLVRVDEES